MGFRLLPEEEARLHRIRSHLLGVESVVNLLVAEKPWEVREGLPEEWLRVLGHTFRRERERLGADLFDALKARKEETHGCLPGPGSK